MEIGVDVENGSDIIDGQGLFGSSMEEKLVVVQKDCVGTVAQS